MHIFQGGCECIFWKLLLIKEFVAKIGFTMLIKKKFKTNDTSVRFHKDDENLMQMIYQVISAYSEDDCADELTLDPVFNAILEKKCLASHAFLQLIQLVQATDTSCKHAKTTGGYHPFKADKECCKGDPFSRIYHLQTMQ